MIEHKKSKTSGITLIALVVTIIVLLILAGVSIMMLTGDDGILTRAGEAKDANDVAQIEERIKTSYLAALAAGHGTLTEENLKTELTNEFGSSKVTDNTIDKSTTGKWTITIDDVSYTVNAGTENKPKSNLTTAEQEAIAAQNASTPTDTIAELSTEDIATVNNQLLTNGALNSRLKAVLTGGVPLTIEMTYITGTVNTGVVVAIGKTETDPGNEFVWVPVPNVIWDGTTEITSGTYTPMGVLQDGSAVNYRGVTYEFQTYPSKIATYKNPRYEIEPEVVESDTGSYISQGITKEILQNEYNTMITSVNRYKGFYVARYELGLEYIDGPVPYPVSKNANTSTAVQTANSGLDVTKMWYGLYKMCKRMYDDNTEKSTQNVTSQMIWGSQYDAMINWIMKEHNEVIDVWNSDNQYKQNHSPVTGLKASRDGDIVNNIYDLYGCHYEWTLESSNSYHRTIRGGDCEYTASPAYSNGYSPYCTTQSGNNGDGTNGISSRPTIYIKQ